MTIQELLRKLCEVQTNIQTAVGSTKSGKTIVNCNLALATLDGIFKELDPK